MKWYVSAAFAVLLSSLLPVTMPASLADGPILLVTPQGVFQSNVVNNRPGPWEPVSIDVIVQGFPVGSPPVVVPPPGETPANPQVQQVAALSKTVLNDKSEATAVAAIVEALAKSGLSGTAFKDAIVLSAPLADSSLKAYGRVFKWVHQATAISTDPAVLAAGLRAAFDIPAATVDLVVAQASREEGAALAEEATDFAAIIQLVTMIIELLQKLGII